MHPSPDPTKPAQRYPLASAQKLAEKIAAEISPFCAKVEIAGSIRRRRPTVGDIDLVCLPNEGRLAALQARFRENCTALSEGVQNAMYQLRNGIQVDVFFAFERHDLLSPMTTNWGTLLLCRTGSAAHNIFLIQRAKDIGRIWRPYAGVFSGTDGACLASATEDDIFKALNLHFIPPDYREL